MYTHGHLYNAHAHVYTRVCVHKYIHFIGINSTKEVKMTNKKQQNNDEGISKDSLYLWIIERSVVLKAT